MYDKLNESVKNILNEFQAGSNEELAAQWEKAVEGDYTQFVSQLKGWAQDPKIINFLKSGREDGIAVDDKFTITQGSIPCSQLIPTQNEIDLNKSLDYPMKDPSCMEKYRQGGEVMVGNAPIITFNGKYIIDGHHRWSQVYCINPNAKMKVINFNKKGMSPQDMLKATQVAIAVTSGNVPVATVNGQNLLTMAPKEIYAVVLERISDEAARAFGAKSKQGAAQKIAMNCKKMQTNNQPIPGAPSRNVMPQTDEPKGNYSNVVKALSQGIAQIGEPFVKQVKSEKVPVQQESVKRGMNEDLNSLLSEAGEETVEQADPVTMFQDFSDVTGQFADIYSTLVNYQTSHVQSPKVAEQISSIMAGVQHLMKQATTTMQMMAQGFGINESKQVIKESVDPLFQEYVDAISAAERARIQWKQLIGGSHEKEAYKSYKERDMKADALRAELEKSGYDMVNIDAQLYRNNYDITKVNVIKK